MTQEKEHNTLMCFPLKPVFTRDKGRLPNFMDEPTTYLDIRYQLQILKLIRKLNREYGMTIIMVLHDINQSLYYSDEIAAMKEGQIIAKGKPEDVINSELIRSVYGVELEVSEVDGKPYVLTV